ncbi:unannotated protein [freshwater metagenome]|uniref:Unannotated protein n=1 Tax=freshwater metagenome TaxID=449393 RepID=A0A6J7HJM3_9ZZZZ
MPRGAVNHVPIRALSLGSSDFGSVWALFRRCFAGRYGEAVELMKAGLGRRLGALCIDWGASLLVVQVLFGRTYAYGSTESSLITGLVFIAEVAVLTSLMGGSFGQVLLGVRVVRTDGSRLWPLRVLGRTLLLFLVIPAVIMDSDGRGLHDKAVDSRTIRVSRA